MYQRHWGLEESPFASRVNPGSFYESPTHEEALARLDFLVDERRRLGLLMGPAGSGKSLVIGLFARRSRDLGRVAVEIGLVGVEPEEFPVLLAIGLGLNPRPGLSGPAIWRLVGDRIAEFRYQQTPTVLLLDDADGARPAVLTQVTRLAKSESGPDSRLTIVLAGQPTPMGRLGTALLERADLRIDLEAWERADTAQFIESSLRKAGRSTPVFGGPAVTRLHELAQGIPRRVSQLADLALVAGAGRNLTSIDAETVDSACRELGTIEVKDEG